jgi:hypothetical protein
VKHAAHRHAFVTAVLAIGVAAYSLVAAACSSASPAAASQAVSPAQATQRSASPSTLPVQPSRSPSSPPMQPSPTPSPVQASTVMVAFSGWRAGTYPVHLHSRCNGSQGLHITVAQNLRVASGGTGAIGVPRAYFGRGLCLIIYASPTLAAVLTTRPI